MAWNRRGYFPRGPLVSQIDFSAGGLLEPPGVSCVLLTGGSAIRSLTSPPESQIRSLAHRSTAAGHESRRSPVAFRPIGALPASGAPPARQAPSPLRPSLPLALSPPPRRRNPNSGLHLAEAVDRVEEPGRGRSRLALADAVDRVEHRRLPPIRREEQAPPPACRPSAAWIEVGLLSPPSLNSCLSLLVWA